MSLFIILIISLIFTGLIAIYGSYYSMYFSRDAIKKGYKPHTMVQFLD